MAGSKSGGGALYVATDSALVNYEGQRVVIHKDVTRIREGHPILTEHPDLFKPIDAHFDVESVTAAPGETRGGRRSSVKAEDKADEK